MNEVAEKIYFNEFAFIYIVSVCDISQTYTARWNDHRLHGLLCTVAVQRVCG